MAKRCAILVSMICLACMSLGCGFFVDEGGNTSGKDKAMEMPGTLSAVQYSRGSGSEARTEFDIVVTPNEVLTCGYWPENGDDFVEKSHVAIAPEQWADVEKICTILFPVMSPYALEVEGGVGGAPSRQAGGDPDPAFAHPLDGGDYSKLIMFVYTPEGEQAYSFSNTSDRRIHTLYALLQELADPQGREIPWYEEPVLDGFFFRDNARGVSYQLSRHYDESGRYRFIASWEEGGSIRTYDVLFGEDVFAPIREALAPLKLEEAASGRYQDKYYCSLYISDGKQLGKKLSRAQAAEIHAIFEPFFEQVQSGEIPVVGDPYTQG